MESERQEPERTVDSATTDPSTIPANDPRTRDANASTDSSVQSPNPDLSTHAQGKTSDGSTTLDSHQSQPTPNAQRSHSSIPMESSELAVLVRTGPIEPGQTLFGRYLVERHLGEGGMGSVWLVRHLELDAPRALKLIVPELAFDSRSAARFKREARLMAKLSHPNAVAVHDARMAANAAFIEMEYVPSGTLAQRLRPGVPMSPEWVARIAFQLCDVIQAAHDLGIMHRDLKPSNLMLVEGRSPGRELLKVVDFGIAKIFDPEQRSEDDNITRSGGAAFTPQYASPEQISGGDVDGRSDIYSIGVILYELLTGYRPFSGGNLLYQHLCASPLPFAEKNPSSHVPPGMEQVVLKCLAKDPSQRPQSAMELSEALQHIYGSLDVASGSFPIAVIKHTPQNAQAASVPATERAPMPSGNDQSTLRFDTILPRTEKAPPDPKAQTPVISSSSAASTPRWQKPSARPNERRFRWYVPGVLALLIGGLAFGFWRLNRTQPNTNPVSPSIETPTSESPIPKGYRPEPNVELVNGMPRILIQEKSQARFILITGAEFMMGDDSGDSTPGARNRRDERPAHPVRLSDYYLQETEVTNSQMESYFQARGIEKSARPRKWLEALAERSHQGRSPDRFPAVGIPHEMAVDFAHWLGGELPTEAQWEFAARSGGKARIYVWGNDAWKPGLAILAQHGDEAIHPELVGESRDVTEQGIKDLAGNVREWCRDVYGPYTTSPEPVLDPAGPPVPADNRPVAYVVRGGSFGTYPDAGRTTGPRIPTDRDGSYTREQIDSDDKSADDLGFRLVIELPRTPGRKPVESR